MMSKIIFVLFALVIVFGPEAEAKRKLDQLKEFEKYSPYPWTQWLSFHPSSASAAAVGLSYSKHRTPPPVLIPPVETTDPDYEEDDDDDDIGFLKRAVAPPTTATDPKAAKAQAKLDKEIAKIQAWAKKTLEKSAKTTTTTTTHKPLVEVPLNFWEPSPLLNGTVMPPGYWAAKKSMFVSKLFEALANVLMNSTSTETSEGDNTGTTVTPSTFSLTTQFTDDNDENVLLNDVVRSAIERTEEPEPEASTTDVSKVTFSTTDQTSVEVEEPTTTVPLILAKKLDFLKKLTALLKTTTPTPAKLKSTSEKSTTSSDSKKSKSQKPVVPAQKPSVSFDELSYEALAKAILGIPQ